MKKHLVEAVGTFFLVMTIPLALTYAGDLAPLAIGAVLMVMIYAGGHVSGAHFNPAVSLALRMRGKMSPREMVGYRIAQLIGAVAAAFVALYLLGGELSTGALTASTGQIIVAEFLFAFALVRVILHTTTDKETENNSFYGLAIGFTVLAGAYAVGGISGGSFNPAVTIGGSIAGIFARSTLWMHLVGQFIGALCAAKLYLVIQK